MLMNNHLSIGPVKSIRMQEDHECTVWLSEYSKEPAATRCVMVVLENDEIAKIVFHLTQDEAAKLWNQRQMASYAAQLIVQGE